MKSFLSLLLASFCLVALSAQDEKEQSTDFNPSREWTNAEGTSTFKGKVTKYDGKTARITPEGKAGVSLPVDKLSESDRAWLEENKNNINGTTVPADKIDPTVPTTEMGKQLAAVKPFSKAKINLGAKYYFVLFSASWCGPCREEMPDIVKMYKNKISKSPELELIHVSCDKNMDDAKDWAKKERMPFPAITKADLGTLPLISANSPKGIPHMYLYNGEGKRLANGHPSTFIKDLKSILKNEGINLQDKAVK